ncbi:MAG TPA: VWA domain-containing protein [Candidatus Binataceae bacterium]|nr:VWA domain-containing protein [Candidatus Binataceae bacterium]
MRAVWAIVAVLLAYGAGPARAQQNVSPMLIPNQRGNQSGEVLEIPRTNNQTQILPPGAPPNLAPQPGVELEIPGRQLRNQPGYAQVTVTVTNSSGVHITDLTQKDFRVYEDNQQRSIAFFRRDVNTPVSVGILVDTSGSMEPKIPQARLAIANFVRDLNAQDDVFLFAFSDRPFLLQPFTTNHDAVLSRLALLHAYGRTALYDVILDGLIMVSRGRYDKKALLVVTDGMDTASASELQQVVTQARRQGVLIYSIGIGDPNTSGSSIGIGAFIFGGSDLDRVDAQVLQTLSAETGAKTFIVRQVGDGDLLNAACEAISNELREQYTLGFLSNDPSAGGYRGIKVEVPSRPELKVRVRKGVTVGHNPTYAAGSGPG